MTDAPKQEEVRIGLVADFPSLPVEIELDGRPYWLVHNADEGSGYRLLLAVCPHAGGDIRLAGEAFYCPLHFWTFDATDGHCTSMDDERLMYRTVELRNEQLFAVGGDR